MHLPDNTNMLFLKLVYKPSQQTIMNLDYFVTQDSHDVIQHSNSSSHFYAVLGCF